jgi:predicted SnoaL-like aldol condensation-catalyzing enzyme
VTADDNKRATQRFIDHAWNGGQYEQTRDHLAPDFINHTPVGEETRDDFLARVNVIREAFPDFCMTVDDILTDGDFDMRVLATTVSAP